MIKNILFDVDNTILDSSSENAIFYKEALESIGYDVSRYLDVYNAIDLYEDNFTEENNFYSKFDMLKLINQELCEDYPLQLIDEINKVIAKYWLKKILINKDIMEYLYSKYDLYVFSNWFYVATYNRLKNINYLKYFKEIFTADKVGSKPYKRAFENVLTKINSSSVECMMIGDSLKTDILGARNANMSAIWFNPNSKPVTNIDGVKMITDFSDIYKIL